MNLDVSDNKRLTDMRCHGICQSDKRLTDICHGARQMNLDMSDNKRLTDMRCHGVC